MATVDTPKVERPASLVSTVTGHLLVTEPQNLLQQRFEQIERGYEELEEAYRR